MIKDQVAIVTGASRGIGKEIALKLAGEGAKLTLVGSSQDVLQSAKDLQEQGFSNVIAVQADVANEEDMSRVVQSTLDQFGQIDILVNNAGIMDHFAPVAELDNSMWEKVMNINVTGPMKAMRSAIKIFLAKGSGCIINIASIGGLQGARAGAAYTASKHALIGLTKNTGYLYAKSGIRCNAIAPGAVNTNIGDTIDMSKITPLINDRIMSGMVLNAKTGEPSDIANVALFLATDDAGFINGAVITVDGGWTAY